MNDHLRYINLYITPQEHDMLLYILAERQDFFSSEIDSDTPENDQFRVALSVIEKLKYATQESGYFNLSDSVHDQFSPGPHIWAMIEQKFNSDNEILSRLPIGSWVKIGPQEYDVIVLYAFGYTREHINSSEFYSISLPSKGIDVIVIQNYKWLIDNQSYYQEIHPGLLESVWESESMVAQIASRL